MYTCGITTRESQQTISIRTRTSAQNIQPVLQDGYTRLIKYLADQNGYPAGPPYVAFFNTDMEDMEIELGIPVSEKLPPQDDIQPSEISSGRVASCIHTGPYNEIEGAYTALTEWVRQNGYEPTGVAYEFYLNDPAQTPPQELQTQVEFPIK
ncbi:MAG: GyrI-like domain-containing protein [Chitinivibrionales bacterium]